MTSVKRYRGVHATLAKLMFFQVNGSAYYIQVLLIYDMYIVIYPYSSWDSKQRRCKRIIVFFIFSVFFCLNSHCATSTSKYQKIISKRWLKGKRLSSHAIFDLCFELLPQFNGRKKMSIQKLHVINFWEKAADLHAACVFCKHLACVNLSCLRGEQQEVTTLESHLPRPSGSHVTYIGRK